MAEKTVSIILQQTKPIKILKWKVQEGVTVPIGRLLLLFDFEEAQKPEQRKLKSTHAGTVQKILAQEGDSVKPGEVLLELEACCHPTIMNDMCAECGADLRKEDVVSTASVPMIHAIPDLKVSEEVAQKLGRADNERLIKDRKLVLLVDLDQTLIHTTNDNIPPNIKDVCHFQLYGPTSPWYHTRLRPGTHKFLNSIHHFYELHICTFGARNYAHTIAMYLDANQHIFSNRILSRDECFDPTSKKANLKALFPCGDNMVCIIDDREDVWSHATNLIHVKPYHFFQHTGDINAPPGLDKHEDDNKSGVDLTKAFVKKNSVEKMETRPPDFKDDEDSEDNEKDKQIKDEEKEEVKADNEKEVKNAEQEIKNDEETEIKTEEKNEIKTEEENETKDKKEYEIQDSNLEHPHQESESTDTSANEQINGNKILEDAVIPEKNIQIETEVDSNEINGNVESQEKSIKQNSENSKLVQDAIEDKTTQTQQTEETADSEDNVKKLPETLSNENKILEINSEQKPLNNPNNENNLIEVEDPDDYLIYLEDILKRIHREFYEQYDHMETGEIPDLKQVIPRVRNNVLKGSHLVFSGLVATHIKLEQSKAYQVARSLGATVTQDLEDNTTHLVAVRPGTAKVNAGRRKRNLKIVTPDWLWCCAERWEQVDERIFPLNSKGSKNRHPPPHCSSPEHIPTYPEHNTPALRRRTPSGRFMDTINPLMSFSSDDIADMDKEDVEEEIKLLPIDGRRLVNVNSFLSKLMEINCHNSELKCSLNMMEVLGEKREGFVSIIVLKCKTCNCLFEIPTDDQTVDINKRVAVKTIDAGLGYSHLQQMTSSLDIPCMSELMFYKVQGRCELTAINLMREAALEEKKLAVEAGDVDSNGVPLITVICSGHGVRRSYRTNYSTLSMTSAIIGYKTKKVLHIGVPNTFCVICTYTKTQNMDPKSHTCCKQWDTSTTNLETEIIADGFSVSEEMYGIIYEKVIINGDSSCYKTILKRNPYNNIQVQQIKCWNRLLKNYIHEIKELAKEVHLAPPRVRRKVQVEDILDDDSDSSEDELKKTAEPIDENVTTMINEPSSSSSSEDSMSADYPKGFKRKRGDIDDGNLDELYNSTEDESPSVKFRRGESVDDMVDMDPEDTQDSEGSIDPPDETDDREWNMMGAALEREFLAE